MEKVYSDFTVVGGGLAGICSAIAAARYGLKVSLVHDRPVLGGNASSEIGVCINGSAAGGGSPSVYAREGGLIEEIKLTIQKYNPEIIKRTDAAIVDMAFFEMIYKEKNIALYLNTSVYDVCTKDKEIKKVSARQLVSEKEFEFISQYYADCSGDGIVAFKAGVPYMMGREAKDQFDESLAPNKADSYTMGSTLIFESRDAGRKVSYKRPDFAYDITKMDFFKNLSKRELYRNITRKEKNFSGYWWIEYGGQVDTIKDSEEIALELRKLVYGFWDYIKNSGDYEEVDNLILTRVSSIPGKRESRRFIGDYVLNQKDIDNKADFKDAVCIGGWTMDEHAPKGIYDEGPATHWYFVPGIYNIPFSSMYPKEISNLMFAGRNISATHIAISSTRVMSTCGCMGQAVGTAAYLCKKYNAAPIEIKEKYCEELIELLQKDDQTIVGKREKYNNELIKDINISSTSNRQYSNVNSDGQVPLNREICMAIPICSYEIDSLEIKMINKSDKNKELKVEVWGGNLLENYIPQYKLKDLKLDVPGGFNEWLKVSLDCSIPKDKKIYLIFSEQSDLSLYTSSEEATGVILFDKRIGNVTMSNPKYQTRWSRIQAYPCFRNVLPIQNMYSIENVINGFSRPYGTPNMWSSEFCNKGEEQWIEMEYNKPKKISEIHLILNSGLMEDNLSQDNLNRVIKDYDIEITDFYSNTKKIITRDNYLRLCKHIVNCENVVKIKIKLKATNGHPFYEIFSVKFF